MHHVFITGVSSGIGAAVARAAVAAGWRVSGCARREQALAALRQELGDAACLQTADVTDPAALAMAVQTAIARHGAIKVLVANAGQGCDGALAELEAERLRQVLAVNLLGVHHTLQAARPHLAAGACIQIVSSIVAWLPIPLMGAYCASKHALQAYAMSLRMELRDAGIDVVTVNPGTVATAFFARAEGQGGERWSYRPGAALPPERLARAMLRQWHRRQRELILPRRLRFVRWAARTLPGLYERMLGHQLRRQRSPGTDKR